MEKPLTISLIYEYCRSCHYFSLRQLVGLLKRVFDDVATNQMAQLRLIHRTALLLLHDVVPCADIRLALDEDRYPRLYLVVIQHWRGFYSKTSVCLLPGFLFMKDALCMPYNQTSSHGEFCFL